MKQLKHYLYAFTALALLAMPALAVDGVTLIDPAAVQSQGGYPYVIAAPGSYRLSANLSVDNGNAAFNIVSPNAVLDLNGFNVNCKFCPNEPGILVQARGITIMNGTVSGFGASKLFGGAIVVTENAGLDLKGVSIMNSLGGMTALANSVVSISDCFFYNLGKGGITFNGSSLSVRNSSLQTLTAQEPAIYVATGTALVTGNVFRENGFGVSVASDAARAQVTGNNFADTLNGIYAGGATLVSSNIFSQGIQDMFGPHVVTMHNNVCSSSGTC